MQENIRDILKQYWGYPDFREKQEEIILSILSGKDTLALLPTGGGKSICFQVPGIAMGKITLVISPLIALMQDQVDQLLSRGISATSLSSALTYPELQQRLENAKKRQYQFIYLSPERLATKTFAEVLPSLNIGMIAVDEAHCISQWGYDFRPSYLRIAKVREILPEVPILALTATATPKVVDDIQNKLLFSQPNLIKKSFARPNLGYVIHKTADTVHAMLKISRKLQGSGIIYCNSRRKTKQVADMLLQNKISATNYHAGLTTAERAKRQQQWIQNKTRVMVATNAFGMGIDKPDVRWVIHIDYPSSPEAYFQEAGRGGRDGKRAWSVLFANRENREQLMASFEKSFPDIPTVKKTYDALSNFLQIPINGGEGASFDMDMDAFILNFKLNIAETHASFRLLEREGLLSFTDGFFKPSSLMILVERDHLYKFQVENIESGKLMNVILRSYSGLFNDYINISEKVLALRSKHSIEKVVQLLQFMHKSGIVSYRKATDKPRITYLVGRRDTADTLISRERYEHLKNMSKKQVDAMLTYTENPHTCRSILLLEYFGEQAAQPCGICDVCRKERKNNIPLSEFKEIKNAVYELLKANKSLKLAAITKNLSNYGEQRTLQVLQWLIDQDILVSNKEKEYYWEK